MGAATARRDVAAGVLVAAALWWLVRADGGFYQRSWAFAEVVLLFALAALVALRGLPLGRAEAAFAGGLAAFTAWTALSALWSESVPRTILEVQRDLLYPAGALVLLVARPAARAVAAGVLAAATAACGVALVERLLGRGPIPFDHRLAAPIGYANGMGLLAVLGLLLAVGLALEPRAAPARAAAAATTVPLAAALWFTFGRGSWLALAAGLAVAVAAARERARLAAAALALAVPAGLAIWLCAASRPLARAEPTAALRHDGHRALAGLVVLALAAAAIGVGLPRLRPRLPRRLAVALAAVPVAAALAATIPYGGPVRVVERARASFASQPPAARQGTRQAVADPRTRLFDAHGSGRLQLWRVAWRDAAAHPLGGSGAGTFAVEWTRGRPSILRVEDAHSLYLETLAEVGPLGLALLAATLAVPLVAGARRREGALLGAYAAYLAHAAIDWDWELAALTLAAVACGAALVARPDGEAAPASGRARAALALPAVVLLGLAFVGLVGAAAVTDAGRRPGLAAARRAVRWAPWQAEAWRLLGDARLAAGDRTGAAAAYRSGLRRDGSDWRLWSRLAAATSGRERARALANLHRLDPRCCGQP